MMGKIITILVLALLTISVIVVPSDVYAEGNVTTFVTYEGHTYDYSTHFNDGVYEDDTYWSEIVSFKGNGSSIVLVQSSLEGYPLFRIGSEAFDDDNVETVVIPHTVRDIMADAFAGCDSLADVYFLGDEPDYDVSSFPQGCSFHTMEGKDWSIPTSPIEEFVSDGLRYLIIDDLAYVLGAIEDRTEIVVSDEVCGVRVKTVLPWAFYGCAITSATISSENIEERAFMECASLMDVTLSDDVVNIDNEAFRKCTSLGSLDLKNVRYIGFESFRDCSSIQEIVIPETVVVLEEGAFYICSSLVSVVMHCDLDNLLPRTFGYCSSLIDVELCDVISIGNSCFINDESLGCIIVPDSVKYIGDQAFSGCIALNEIVISNCLETIGASAFRDCRSLRQVSLGEHVGFLGDLAFGGCRVLENVHFDGPMPCIGADVFHGVSDDFKVTYESEYRDSWSEYHLTEKEMIDDSNTDLIINILRLITVLVVFMGIVVYVRCRRSHR